MGKYSDGKDGSEAGGSYPLVAVCIDKDKNSQNALKYATETLVHKGQTVVLVHVNTKGISGGVEDAAGYRQPTDPQMKELFLPFRCFCTRKDIHCEVVVLDDHDVSKSIVEFAAHAAIEKLVVGATAMSGFVRFKADIPSSISKTAPDFSTVYVISKGGKVSSVRQATRQAPAVSPLRTMIQGPKPEHVPTQKWTPAPSTQKMAGDAAGTPRLQDNLIMSPFTRGLNASARKAFPDFSLNPLDRKGRVRGLGLLAAGSKSITLVNVVAALNDLEEENAQLKSMVTSADQRFTSYKENAEARFTAYKERSEQQYEELKSLLLGLHGGGHTEQQKDGATTQDSVENVGIEKGRLQESSSPDNRINEIIPARIQKVPPRKQQLGVMEPDGSPLNLTRRSLDFRKKT